ncbi:MAG: adenosylcobalamin-dependent ribonucleoside-diphosphate reductase [FCB group bacterium]|nr:adenosylcobalamin-dependent ribonucleoside-diphosphate reductase [FCB group bacterium]
MTIMEKMFEYQGKTTSLIGKKKITAYRELYEYLSELQVNGKLPFHGDYLGDNELAKNIYSKKYFLKDLEGNLLEHHPEETFIRIAAFMSTVEVTKTKKREWAEKFYTELYQGRFVPGGRVLAGSGDLFRLKTLANCFVSKIDHDDIDSIYHTAFECARTYSYGGGIGVDISSLRPKDAIVHNAADSSTGAVSFMDLYSLTTGLIGQSGRRGALMMTIDVKHPDIFNFINVKQTPNWVTKQIIERCEWSKLFDDEQLKEISKHVMENTQIRFANISIKVSDEFMQAVNENNTFPEDHYLVYQKNNPELVMNSPQSDKNHYSVGIPSKSPEDYKLLHNFATFTELNNWLFESYGVSVAERDLLDKQNRDIYGDYVVQLNELDYDFAIKQAGDFMLYFSSEPTGEIRRLVKAREIWDQFIEGNYRTAEPGLIFWTTMSKFSPSNYVGRPIISTNPCAEVPLEDGGACNLGSLNLSRFVVNGYDQNAYFDWDQLAETIRILVRFLDNVVIWNEKLNALEKQRISASETRRLGLGVMGIADMMNQLGLEYDSPKSFELIDKVMSFIANAAYQASSWLAEEKGPSPVFSPVKYLQCPYAKSALSEETRSIIKKKGLRNIAILSIAPTGSISNIVLGYQSGQKNYIGVSGGIEPIFALYYTRRSESFNNKFYNVFHATVQAYIDKMGLTSEAAANSDMTSILPAYFHRTAHNIHPDQRVKIQSICQKYIDHSISSTVNLPEDTEPELISNIYIKAWESGLKGITIYRDGSRFPILAVEEKASAFQKAKLQKYKIDLPDGTEAICHGDEILKLPNGRLTTVYHYMNRDNLNIEDMLLNTHPEEVIK